MYLYFDICIYIDLIWNTPKRKTDAQQTSLKTRCCGQEVGVRLPETAQTAQKVPSGWLQKIFPKAGGILKRKLAHVHIASPSMKYATQHQQRYTSVFHLLLQKPSLIWEKEVMHWHYD